MAPVAPGISGRLVEEASELESLQSSWDALAVAAGSPFGAPAWALAWWRHMAPDGARLAVVAVHQDDDLIGLAPFYASGRGVKQLRLLSGGWASRLGILARPGSEPEVAAAISETLADSDLRPDVIRWEAVDADSPWPGWLSDKWPDDRGHRLQDLSERSAPILHLGELPYDEWFGAKSRNFRSQMRRDRRAMEGQGATFRSADRGSLGRDLEAFAGLHSSRWEGRGGSSAVNPGAMAALQEVGEALVEEGRFRIWMIDGPDGEPVSAQVFVAAGGNVAYWNGGFDERWGKHHPGAVAILAAVEEAFERGDELIDLGGGEARYKERLADEDRPVAWRTSYRRGLGYPLARLRQLPEQVARRGSGKLRERLGRERLNRLRGLLRR
jgi:CelD/BcsL family acetyltransferase involved in cellulose biosynthesis